MANRGVQVSYGGDQIDGVGLQGCTTNTFQLSNTQVALGRFYTDTEDQRRLEVVFLGSDIKDRLFPIPTPSASTSSLTAARFR